MPRVSLTSAPFAKQPQGLYDPPSIENIGTTSGSLAAGIPPTESRARGKYRFSLACFRLLISHVQKAEGQISFTTDIWSSKNRRSFLAVTAHWISQEGTGPLHLRAALIAFQQLHGPHDGVSLATTMMGLLDRCGITRKVELQRL